MQLQVERINFERFSIDGKDIDFYIVSYKEFLSTKEISLWIDFTNEAIWGEIVSHVEWWNILKSDLAIVKKVLELLKQHKALKRDFTNFVHNIIED